MLFSNTSVRLTESGVTTPVSDKALRDVPELVLDSRSSGK
jgi:hypothetical protein